MKGTGYPLHSPVSPSLPHPCVTACHHISAGVYLILSLKVQPSSHCLFCCNTHVIIAGIAVELCGVFKHADYENRSVSSFRYIDNDDSQSPSETRQFPVVIFHTDRSRRNRIEHSYRYTACSTLCLVATDHVATRERFEENCGYRWKKTETGKDVAVILSGNKWSW